jgi:CpeT protein
MLSLLSRVFLCTLCLFNFSESKAQLSSADVDELLRRMVGKFNSEAQSLQDSSFFHITLQMMPIAPVNNKDHWLYVEQAMASTKHKPYRQRVYQIRLLSDSCIESKVYELKNPSAYINPVPGVIRLTIDSLTERQGCSIFLKKVGNAFTGSTPGKECLSNLRGATHATSEVVIESERMISWDRGWDREGKQVWGAQKSGYQFVKVKE